MPLNLSEWVKDHVPIEDELSAAPTIRRTRRKGSGETAANFWLRVAHNYVIRCNPSVAGEDGHRDAFRVACVLIIGFNIRFDYALPIFKSWNRFCRPPWSDEELRHKLGQAQDALTHHPSPGYLRENLRKSKQRSR